MSSPPAVTSIPSPTSAVTLTTTTTTAGTVGLPLCCDDMGRLSEEQLKRKPEDVFDIVQKLGEGSYGSVYKAIHKESQHVLAIKQVPLDTDLQEIIKEISIMQQCDSPFIVRYYGSYFRNDELLIVMEYCDGGSVSDIMRMRRRTLSEEHIATILRDALYGLEYLHARRRIHRDIKAGNILLSVSENHAKLADFGVAGQLTDTMAKRNTVIGTPFWMAPEVIQEVGYDCSADIWSLGITAIEMAEGKPPYAEIHPMRAIFMIPTKPPPSFRSPDNWSQEFIDFVSQCLVKNADMRSSATQLLEADYLKQRCQPFESLHAIIAEAADVREQKRCEAAAEQKLPGMSTDTIRAHGGAAPVRHHHTPRATPADGVDTSAQHHHHHRRHQHHNRRQKRKTPTAPSPASAGVYDTNTISSNGANTNADTMPDFADKTVKLSDDFASLRLQHHDDTNHNPSDLLLSPASAAATATHKTLFSTTRSNSTVIIYSSSSDDDEDGSSGSSGSTEGPDDDVDYNTAQSINSTTTRTLHEEDNNNNNTVCRHSTTEMQDLYGTTHPYRPVFMQHFPPSAPTAVGATTKNGVGKKRLSTPTSNNNVLESSTIKNGIDAVTQQQQQNADFIATTLHTMPLDQLEQRIRDLDMLMERELEELRIKYLEKRKPITEAIEEKKRTQQMHF